MGTPLDSVLPLGPSNDDHRCHLSGLAARGEVGEASAAPGRRRRNCASTRPSRSSTIRKPCTPYVFPGGCFPNLGKAQPNAGELLNREVSSQRVATRFPSSRIARRSGHGRPPRPSGPERAPARSTPTAVRRSRSRKTRRAPASSPVARERSRAGRPRAPCVRAAHRGGSAAPCESSGGDAAAPH
jgi:hypothetical protein